MFATWNKMDDFHEHNVQGKKTQRRTYYMITII